MRRTREVARIFGVMAGGLLFGGLLCLSISEDAGAAGTNPIAMADIRSQGALVYQLEDDTIEIYTSDLDNLSSELSSLGVWVDTRADNLDTDMQDCLDDVTAGKALVATRINNKAGSGTVTTNLPTWQELATGVVAVYDTGDSVGYTRGYGEGDEAGYIRGYDEGDSAGYTRGYSAGNSDGDSAGYTRGYNAGKKDGDAAGYTRGYNEGDSAGYTRGYSAGNSAGYNRGYGAGDSAGYTRGYNAGVAAKETYKIVIGLNNSNYASCVVKIYNSAGTLVVYHDYGCGDSIHSTTEYTDTF